MKYFLGMDVGSSKTHTLIADETGQCVGFGRGGAGNYQNVGHDGLRRVIKESFEMARQMAGVGESRIAGAGFGVAGYDFPSDREAHLHAISFLGLSCPVEIVNDGMNGLLAGATNGIGVNVTAGSSVNCRGKNREGKIGRIVGNGEPFGEYGGAKEIMHRGLQLVSQAWTKRIPPTTLTRIYLNAMGAKDELDLMEGVSNGRYQLRSSIAVEVIAAARSGDSAACGIVEWAGEELGMVAVAVARQIEMENDEVEIIQSGSVFEAGGIITNPMQRVVLSHCPKAKLNRLDGPPVVGAVILGMEQAGFNGYKVRDVMIQSAKKIVSSG